MWLKRMKDKSECHLLNANQDVAPGKPSNFTNVCMGGGGGRGGRGGASLFPPPCKGVTLYSNIFACFQGITFNTRHFSLFYGALSSIVNGCSLTELY